MVEKKKVTRYDHALNKTRVFDSRIAAAKATRITDSAVTKAIQRGTLVFNRYEFSEPVVKLRNGTMSVRR